MTIRLSLAPIIASSMLALLVTTAPVNAQTFTITKLVSNQPGEAKYVDPNLVNAWGIAHSSNGPRWVVDNETNVATAYQRDTGRPTGMSISIPGGEGTGIVHVPGNGQDNDDFVIRRNGTQGESSFIFVNENGLISGYNSAVDPATAVIAVNLRAQNASLKGVTLLNNSNGVMTLYVADFHNNRVRMYDEQFREIGRFTDPSLPKRFAPFNVKAIRGNIFVAFAEREKGGDDEVAGPGLGYIDVFAPNGNLLKHLVANGPLNAPWGMTLAPPGFGGLDGATLVGNFGDGKINAFDASGNFMGALQGTDGQDLSIDGLWGIDSNSDGSVDFAAGPDDEANGLLGRITLAAGKFKH